MTPHELAMRCKDSLERGSDQAKPQLYWHCECGINEPAQPEYKRGDSEPCVHCADGVARVVTLQEAAAWEVSHG